MYFFRYTIFIIVSEQCSEVCLIADCTKENASTLCPAQCPEEGMNSKLEKSIVKQSFIA